MSNICVCLSFAVLVHGPVPVQIPSPGGEEEIQRSRDAQAAVLQLVLDRRVRFSSFSSSAIVLTEPKCQSPLSPRETPFHIVQSRADERRYIPVGEEDSLRMRGRVGGGHELGDELSVNIERGDDQYAQAEDLRDGDQCQVVAPDAHRAHVVAVRVPLVRIAGEQPVQRLRVLPASKLIRVRVRVVPVHIHVQLYVTYVS